MRQTVRSHGIRETSDRGIAPRRGREVVVVVVVRRRVMTLVYPRDRIPPPLHSQSSRHGRRGRIAPAVVVAVIETRQPAPAFEAAASGSAAGDEAGRIFDASDFDVERAQREVRLASRRGHQKATHLSCFVRRRGMNIV